MTSGLFLLCTGHCLAVLKGLLDPLTEPLHLYPKPYYLHFLPQGWGLADPSLLQQVLYGECSSFLSLFFKLYQAPTHTSLPYAIQPFLESLWRKEFLKVQLWVPFDLHHEFRDAFP